MKLTLRLSTAGAGTGTKAGAGSGATDEELHGSSVRTVIKINISLANLCNQLILYYRDLAAFLLVVFTHELNYYLQAVEGVPPHLRSS